MIVSRWDLQPNKGSKPGGGGGAWVCEHAQVVFLVEG
jgi:hypothetical protein